MILQGYQQRGPRWTASWRASTHLSPGPRRVLRSDLSGYARLDAFAGAAPAIELSSVESTLSGLMNTQVVDTCHPMLISW